MQEKLPSPVLAVIAPILAQRNTHAGISLLFKRVGAPDEPSAGEGANKVTRCLEWLERTNREAADPFRVVGEIIENIMEHQPREFESCVDFDEEKAQINEALGRYGCRYQQGGRVVPTGLAPSRTLDQILRARDLAAVTAEFDRATATVTTDPPAALTAACAILEALFKVYIEDEGLELPGSPTVKPLWSTVQKAMGLDPAEQTDDDLKRILSGLTSVVDGIGTARTHASSAHGRGRKAYNVKARHARLAVNAAHTLAVFLLETWDDRKAGKA